MKSKPWTILDKSKANCTRCGGTSIWMPGVTTVRGMDFKPLDFFRWWKRFKQVHSKCIERMPV